MKTKYRKPLIYGAAIVMPQLIAFIIDNSQGASFLLSLILLLAYEIYSKTIDAREATLATASFASTTLLISAISKEIIYNSLCDISQNTASTGTSTVLPSEQTCLSFIEIIIKNISANPINTWYFWITNISVAVSAVYIYRTYREDQ